MKGQVIRIQLTSSGGSPEAVLSGVRKDRPDRLFIFTGKKEKHNAIEVEQKISELYKILVKTIIIDEFNIMDCMTNIIKTGKEQINQCIENGLEPLLTMNITGGTKILSSSMLMASNILSASVFYIKSARATDKSIPVEFDERIDIPIPQPLFDPLSRSKLRTLKSVKGIEIPTIQKLSKQLKITKQSLSEQIKELEEANLVRKEISGREKIIHLTDSGELYLSIVLINPRIGETD